MKGNMQIGVGLSGDKSILKNSYCTQPFKISDITEDRSDNTLRLMQRSSSPGILDGDDYHIEISLQPGCSLDLKTQSYQRLFNMQNSASQYMEVQMGENSSLSYLPHPIVPHQSSAFKSTNKIYLTKGCKLTWGEVLTCGRKLSGEAFLFSRYHSLTEIFLDGNLMIKENILMQPSLVDVNTIGQLEGFTHQASLILLDKSMDVPVLIKQLTCLLVIEKDIAYGISATQLNGVIVRLLGNKAEQLFEILKSL